MFKDAAFIEDISPVTDSQGFANIVIGYQYADPPFFQMTDNLLDIQDRYRVDPGKWFIEKNKFWIKDQRPGYLNPTSFTTGQSIAEGLCNMRQTKIFQ